MCKKSLKDHLWDVLSPSQARTLRLRKGRDRIESQPLPHLARTAPVSSWCQAVPPAANVPPVRQMEKKSWQAQGMFPYLQTRIILALSSSQEME